VHRYGIMSGRHRVRLQFLVPFGVSVLLAVVVGCSSHRRNGGGASTPVAGTFREVGGPSPGIDRPIAGDITVYLGTSASGAQVTVIHTDAKGQFHVVLAPGTFFFVGRSPDVGGVPCTSAGPVTLTSAPASVVVTCQIK
jgi:hypothetical protein